MSDNAQDDVIVKCPRCGQMNRIAKHSPDQRAICGKCRADLNTDTRVIPSPPAPPPSAPPPHPTSPLSKQFSGKGSAGKVAGIIAIVMLGGIIWIASTSRPTPSYPPQALPYDGEIQAYTSSEQAAPLEIRIAAGSHCLVRLRNASDKALVMDIFVRSGSTVEVEVPLGTYELHYAFGETWYGYQYRFGRDTAYKADKLLVFTRTGSQVKSHTVTLYKVPHGNLPTSKINADQF
jgi:hypothetical protein